MSPSPNLNFATEYCVTVLVVPTDEERMIARFTCATLGI